MRPEEIRLSDYHYNLPEARIAQHPLEARDQSKLLRYQNGEISHHQFSDLHALLPDNGILVVNDTKVIRARLFFRRKTGALIEILLMAPVFPAEVQQSMQTTQSCQWQCIIGRKKRWKPDELLETEISVKGQSVVLRVSWIEREENILQFDWEAADIVWVDLIEAMGKLPLPPYIQREASEADQQQYQTVYSRHQGAVAAPTAGLHFTDQVFSNLAKKNIHPHALTLHVSAGTFLPVKTDKVVEHDMHAEQFVISREMLIKLRDRNTAVVPVGTTSMRVLESLYWMGKKLLVQKSNDAFLKLDALAPYEKGSAPSLTEAIHALLTHLDQHQMDSLHGETSIFIMPGYKFKLCDGIITNFHMPGTTLILLVAALLGEDWRKVYEAALENDYRFLSYGDSSLLWRNGR